MKISRGDVEFSTSLSNKDERIINEENSSSKDILDYVKNKTDIDEQVDTMKINTKKKYKKNLVWDGPRWDLAYFDPSMSAREKKKLIYYENLFNKLENNDLIMKCGENTSSNVKQTSQRGRKARTNAIVNHISSKELKKENLGNSTKNKKEFEEVEINKELDISIDKLKENQIGNLLTPNRNALVNEIQTPKVNSDQLIKSNSNGSASSIERDNNSIKRYHDWRIKLLNKTGSFQNTPSRITTP